MAQPKGKKENEWIRSGKKQVAKWAGKPKEKRENE